MTYSTFCVQTGPWSRPTEAGIVQCYSLATGSAQPAEVPASVLPQGYYLYSRPVEAGGALHCSFSAGRGTGLVCWKYDAGKSVIPTWWGSIPLPSDGVLQYSVGHNFVCWTDASLSMFCALDAVELPRLTWIENALGAPVASDVFRIFAGRSGVCWMDTPGRLHCAGPTAVDYAPALLPLQNEAHQIVTAHHWSPKGTFCSIRSSTPGSIYCAGAGDLGQKLTRPSAPSLSQCMEGMLPTEDARRGGCGCDDPSIKCTDWCSPRNNDAYVQSRVGATVTWISKPLGGFLRTQADVRGCLASCARRNICTSETPCALGCNPSQTCVTEGTCRQKCTTTDECGADETCVSNTCVAAIPPVVECSASNPAYCAKPNSRRCVAFADPYVFPTFMDSGVYDDGLGGTYTNDAGMCCSFGSECDSATGLCVDICARDLGVPELDQFATEKEKLQRCCKCGGKYCPASSKCFAKSEPFDCPWYSAPSCSTGDGSCFDQSDCVTGQVCLSGQCVNECPFPLCAGRCCGHGFTCEKFQCVPVSDFNPPEGSSFEDCCARKGFWAPPDQTCTAAGCFGYCYVTKAERDLAHPLYSSLTCYAGALCRQWSPWLDRDNPSGTGDWEDLANFRRLFPKDSCYDYPSAIQARVVGSHVPAQSGLWPLRFFDTKNGLACVNADSPQVGCPDFEVRFCCDAPAPTGQECNAAKTQEDCQASTCPFDGKRSCLWANNLCGCSPLVSPECQSADSIAVDLTSGCARVGGRCYNYCPLGHSCLAKLCGDPTTDACTCAVPITDSATSEPTPQPTFTECSSWSPWFDRDLPSGTGDWETFKEQNNQAPICVGGISSGIRGRVKATGQPALESGQILQHFSTAVGLVCVNADQRDGACLNYEVSYCCDQTVDPQRSCDAYDGNKAACLTRSCPLNPTATCVYDDSKGTCACPTAFTPQCKAAPTGGLCASWGGQCSTTCPDDSSGCVDSWCEGDCTCALPPQAISFSTPCKAWTSFFDRDNPSGTGDWETLPELRLQFPGAICDNPRAIEARDSSGKRADPTSTTFLFYDAIHGFVCRNADNNHACLDYSVRFCCDNDSAQSSCVSTGVDLWQPTTCGFCEFMPKWPCNVVGKGLCQCPLVMYEACPAADSEQAAACSRRGGECKDYCPDGHICDDSLCSTQGRCTCVMPITTCAALSADPNNACVAAAGKCLDYCPPDHTCSASGCSGGGLGCVCAKPAQTPCDLSESFSTGVASAQFYGYSQVIACVAGSCVANISAAACDSDPNCKALAWQSCNQWECKLTCEAYSACCAVGAPTPVPPTPPPAIDCAGAGGTWGAFMDRDNPSGTGDWEDNTNALSSFSLAVRGCNAPLAVEARVVPTSPVLPNMAAHLTGESFRFYDRLQGFACINSDQPDGLCLDYEVRWCCGGDTAVPPACTAHKTERECVASPCPADLTQRCLWNSETSACGCATLEPTPPPSNDDPCFDSNTNCQSLGGKCVAVCPDGSACIPNICKDPLDRCGRYCALPPDPAKSCSMFDGSPTGCQRAVCPDTPNAFCKYDGLTNKCNCDAGVAPKCEDWTVWMDRDNPTGTGDWETVTDLRSRYPGAICDKPSAIEARDSSGNLAKEGAGGTDFAFAFYNTYQGFACINDQQADDGRCRDYSVRFCCDDNVKGCADVSKAGQAVCEATPCTRDARNKCAWDSAKASCGCPSADDGDVPCLDELNACGRLGGKCSTYCPGEGHTCFPDVCGTSQGGCVCAVPAISSTGGPTVPPTQPTAPPSPPPTRPPSASGPAGCCCATVNFDPASNWVNPECCALGLDGNRCHEMVWSTGQCVWNTNMATCPLATPKPTATPTALAPPTPAFSPTTDPTYEPRCAGEWTAWLDRDNPSGTGDWEDLHNAQRIWSVCSAPRALHVRTVGAHRHPSLTGDFIFLNSPSTGFVCRNADQPDGACEDYEVRFCCPPATPTPPPTQQVGAPTQPQPTATPTSAPTNPSGCCCQSVMEDPANKATFWVNPECCANGVDQASCTAMSWSGSGSYGAGHCAWTPTALSCPLASASCADYTGLGARACELSECPSDGTRMCTWDAAKATCGCPTWNPTPPSPPPTPTECKTFSTCEEAGGKCLGYCPIGFDCRDELCGAGTTALFSASSSCTCALPRPPSTCDSWTAWFNRDRPSGTGDWETLADMQTAGYKVCANPTAMEARTAVGGVAAASTGNSFLFANAAQGLVCVNADQAGAPCEDYEVRFCCDEDAPHDCSSIGSRGACERSLCPQLGDGSLCAWDEAKATCACPQLPAQCAPLLGCSEARGYCIAASSVCPDGYVCDPTGCDAAVNSNCMCARPKPPAGVDCSQITDVKSCHANLCALDEQQYCTWVDGKGCRCPPQSPSPPTLSPTPSGFTGGECDDGVWTSWLNRDHPSATGDWETLSAFTSSQVPCALPTAIQAATRSFLPAEQTGEVIRLYSPTQGFACVNADQPDGACQDYQVRFCCGPRVPESCSDFDAAICNDRACPNDKTKRCALNNGVCGCPSFSPAFCPRTDLCEGNGGKCTEKLSGCPDGHECIDKYCGDTGECTCVRPVQASFSCSSYNDKPNACVAAACPDAPAKKCEFNRNTGACSCPGDVFPCSKWTNWLDRDNPSGTGDWEAVASFQQEGLVCQNPTAIEGRTTSGLAASLSGETLRHYSASVGLVCVNSEQPDGFCLDYQVRFCCDNQTSGNGGVSPTPSVPSPPTIGGGGVPTAAQTGSPTPVNPDGCCCQSVMIDPLNSATFWVNPECCNNGVDEASCKAMGLNSGWAQVGNFGAGYCQWNPTMSSCPASANPTPPSPVDLCLRLNAYGQKVCDQSSCPQDADRSCKWSNEQLCECSGSVGAPTPVVASCTQDSLACASVKGYCTNLCPEGYTCYDKYCGDPLSNACTCAVKGEVFVPTPPSPPTPTTPATCAGYEYADCIRARCPEDQNRFCAYDRTTSSCGCPSGGGQSACGNGGSWTPWMDRDNPSGTGDWEDLASLRRSGYVICNEPSAVQALTLSGIPASNAGDTLFLYSAASGLVCRVSDQSDGTCEDYKVRFCCGAAAASKCSDIKSEAECQRHECPLDSSKMCAWSSKTGCDCPSSSTPTPSSPTPSNPTPPTSGGGCAATSDVCAAKGGKCMSYCPTEDANCYPNMCGSLQQTTTLTQTSTATASSLFTGSSTSSSTTSSTTTLTYGGEGACFCVVPSNQCKVWTAWMDRDNPSGTGDWEDLASFRNAGYQVCDRPSAIEGQTLGGVPATQTGETLAAFSASQGLICRNADQAANACSDYQVRFCCDERPLVRECSAATTRADCAAAQCPTDASKPCVWDQDRTSCACGSAAQPTAAPTPATCTADTTCKDKLGFCRPTFQGYESLFGSSQRCPDGYVCDEALCGQGCTCVSPQQSPEPCDTAPLTPVPQTGCATSVQGSSWGMTVEPGPMLGRCDAQGQNFDVAGASNCAEALASAEQVLLNMASHGCPLSICPGSTVFPGSYIKTCTENAATRPTGIPYTNYHINHRWTCCSTGGFNNLDLICCDAGVCKTGAACPAGSVTLGSLSAGQSCGDFSKCCPDPVLNPAPTPNDAQTCNSWSEWFNRDRPSGTGDWETLADLQKANPTLCQKPLLVEARTLAGTDAALTGETFRFYDATVGFVCVNDEQADKSCLDYKVRFCCGSGASTPSCTVHKDKASCVRDTCPLDRTKACQWSEADVKCTCPPPAPPTCDLASDRCNALGGKCMETCPEGYQCLEGLCGSSLTSFSPNCLCGVPLGGGGSALTCAAYTGAKDLCLKAACPADAAAGRPPRPCMYNDETAECACVVAQDPPTGPTDFCNDADPVTTYSDQALCCVGGKCMELSTYDCKRKMAEGSATLLHLLQCNAFGVCDRSCANYAACCNSTDPCTTTVEFTPINTVKQMQYRNTVWLGQPFKAPAAGTMGSIKYSIEGASAGTFGGLNTVDSSTADRFTFRLIHLTASNGGVKLGSDVTIAGVAPGIKLPAVDFSSQNLALTAGETYAVVFRLCGMVPAPQGDPRCQGFYHLELVQKQQPDVYWSEYHQSSTFTGSDGSWTLGGQDPEEDLWFSASLITSTTDCEGQGAALRLSSPTSQTPAPTYSPSSSPTRQKLSAGRRVDPVFSGLFFVLAGLWLAWM